MVFNTGNYPPPTGSGGPDGVHFGADGPEGHKPDTVHRYGDWPSQWVVTCNAKSKDFDSVKYHTLWQDKQMMFVNKIPRHNGPHQEAETYLNFQQMNSYLRRSYDRAERRFVPRFKESAKQLGILDHELVQQEHLGGIAELYGTRVKGMHGFSVDSTPLLRQQNTDDDDRTGTYLGKGAVGTAGLDYNDLMRYFLRPEPQWSALYRETNPILHKNEEFAQMFMLTKAGWMSRWNYASVLGVRPQKYYYGFEIPASKTYSMMTLMMKGDFELEDVWDSPCATSELFWMLKRVKVAGTRFFGPLQLVPYSSIDGMPTDSERFYLDFSGRPQYAYVHYVGVVMDNRGDQITDQQRALMRGFVGTAEQQYEASLNAPKLSVFMRDPPGRRIILSH